MKKKRNFENLQHFKVILYITTDTSINSKIIDKTHRYALSNKT